MWLIGTIALIGGCSNAGDEDSATDADAAPTASVEEGPVVDDPADEDSVASTEGAPRDRAATDPIDLLPDDTRGIFVFDIAGLLSSADRDDVLALLDGDGADPAFAELFGRIGRLAISVDVATVMDHAVLVQTTDSADGIVLIASLTTTEFGEATAGATTIPDGDHGSASLHLDENGNHLALLSDGTLVAGTRSAVASVIDVADGEATGGNGPIAPFLAALEPDHHVSLAYGLPALLTDVAPGTTVQRATAMSGTLDIVDGAIGGTLAFHTPAAAEFVEVYNRLNLASTVGDDPPEVPLELVDPVVDDLPQVVVTLAPMALDASVDAVRTSRNVFKKLVAGMDALDYADAVADRSEPAWLDFVVLSERDERTPRSPGSVYIRWEFRDEQARLDFERNELPAGFRLAPTRFLESDAPEGEYFFALNLYNAGGGSIVGGTRAEWDVFVHGPDGADPNAGERPRFMVVDVLSEEVSADSVNLLTSAEPLSHDLVDGLVVSRVGRFDDGVVVPVFESTFPAPDPAEAEVARFTREMAIGNDYIYWGHGVSDRVLYDATTFNHDAYFVDVDRLTFTDFSRWAEYLAPEVKDAVYYENTLRYVASPMANLDSDHLDITPEWLAELIGFTTNGHQQGLMRGAVEQFFRGEADPFIGVHLGNETPATHYHFEITDPAGLEEAIDLPPGRALAPTTLIEGEDEGHFLTLSVYEIDDAVEGVRAEWRVYTTDGSSRPPHVTIVELMTKEAFFDPVRILTLPTGVVHRIDDGSVVTKLSSDTIEFDASFSTSTTSERELTLDWIEAGDIVCHRIGICDSFYYDAETLDVPVNVPAQVSVTRLNTPWNRFIDTEPALVFYRDNAQEYAVKPWFDLDITAEELPFAGLGDRTHSISGSGSLTGRTNDVVDSTYVYTGDVRLDGDRVTFALDQQIDNALGIANIYTTGTFDLSTGSGTQTVVDCIGPALMCSDIENGSTAFYTAQGLDASNPDELTWRVDAAVDLGGTFGTADSSSSLTATAVN